MPRRLPLQPSDLVAPRDGGDRIAGTGGESSPSPAQVREARRTPPSLADLNAGLADLADAQATRASLLVLVHEAVSQLVRV